MGSDLEVLIIDIRQNFGIRVVEVEEVVALEMAELNAFYRSKDQATLHSH